MDSTETRLIRWPVGNLYGLPSSQTTSCGVITRVAEKETRNKKNGAAGEGGARGGGGRVRPT